MPTDSTPDTYDYQHGDTGDRPADGLNFKISGRPSAQTFDWFFNTVTKKIDGIINTLDNILDGTIAVPQAENAAAADTSELVKGNDIDSNGDGIVDTADEARSFESRTDFPSNADAGRVVYRTDLR